MDLQQTQKKKTINPYFNKSFNITLLNSLLDEKYCVYKLLQKNAKQFSHTYLSLHIQNKQQYIIKFYKLNEIEDFDQMQKLRYKVLRTAEIFFNLRSSYVIRCYQVYQNHCYLAIVYQYFQRSSLQAQMMNGMIFRCDYAIILKHMLMAVLAIHRTGLFAKKLDLSKIYFKNGFYKLTQFNIFWSQHDEKDVQICPELRHSKQQHIDEQISPRCDLWALALFYLKLELGSKYNQQMVAKNDSMTIFTRQLQNELQLDLIESSDILEFLKKGLMINSQERLGWPKLFKLLNLETQIKKANILSNNNQIDLCEPSYIEQKMEYDRTSSPSKRRTTTLTRTFLVNTTENIVFQQEQINTCKAYFDEQHQIQINSKSFLMNTQKQNPFYLSLFINQLKYVPLSDEDIEIFLQKLQNKQKNLYQQIESYYFQAQKSQYILKNLIRPIEADNLLDLEKKRNIQFMYLLCSRIFTNLSYVNVYLKKQNNINEQQEKIIKEYQKIIGSTYEQAKKKFTHYSSRLTSSQNTVTSMFFERCKKFANNEEKQLQDCFLVGIEGVDYKKDDQIIFTHRYIDKIMRQLKNNQQNKNIKTLLNICEKYIEIMSLVDTCQIRGKQFKQCVQELLKKDMKKFYVYGSPSKSGNNKMLAISDNKNEQTSQFVGYGEKVANFRKKSSI